MDDLINRQAAIDALKHNQDVYSHNFHDDPIDKYTTAIIAVDIDSLVKLPSAQPEIIRCKDCKYFELDHFEKVGVFPIPIIVAHEICMKWGEGCKSSIDGWCFMAERRKNG